MRNIKTYVLIILSWIIPKENKRYLFYVSPSFQFSGNIAALYRKMSENSECSKVQLLVTKEKGAGQARLENINYIYKNKLARAWSMLRAEKIIIDSHRPNLSRGRFDLIQLWHGASFKNVGLLDDATDCVYRRKVIKEASKYSLVCASSKFDQHFKKICFCSDNVYITGFPRNDVLISIDKSKRADITRNYYLDGFEKIICYTPTFRDKITFQPFSKEEWTEINQLMCSKNYIFVVKKHPRDVMIDVPSGLSNVMDVTDKIYDVQNLLAISDLLISDYSSIFVDYLLMDRPFLIYPYDYKEYNLKCRNQIYNMFDYVPDSFVVNWDKLFKCISNFEWSQDKVYVEELNNMKNFFHFYHDNKSTERVMEFVIKR